MCDALPVWLDCDPGHDDAFAILIASYSPEIKLLGVSIVHGNDSVDHCALNALRILWAIGKDNVKVYKGAQTPIVREPKFCPEIHGIPGEEGVAGMCGYHFPDHEIFNVPEQNDKFQVQEAHGVIAMSTAILSHPRKVIVVLTGAQTNFALALRMFPEIKGNIEKVVFMGGAIGMGNTGVAAEFNIQIDPEAASIVLHSGLPLVMIPLEVTHQVLVTSEILQKLADIDNLDESQLHLSVKGGDSSRDHPQRYPDYPETFQAIERTKRITSKDSMFTELTQVIPKFSSAFAECCYQLLTFFKGTYLKEFGFLSPPLHDPCTIFYLISPQSFRGVDLYVDVEMASEKCAGRTLCDTNNLLKKEKNVFVCTSINVSDFWGDFLAKLKLASGNSPMNKGH